MVHKNDLRARLAATGVKHSVHVQVWAYHESYPPAWDAAGQLQREVIVTINLDAGAAYTGTSYVAK